MSGKRFVWILVVTTLLAAIALYLGVCALFYYGQWQVVFSPPSKKSPALPATAHSELPITNVFFDAEGGVDRLHGWWIPAGTSSTAGSASQTARTNGTASPVLLYCPNGKSDLPQNTGSLQAFHALGISVFAFDYRGFGASQAVHPSQQKAYADGLAAFRYVTEHLHVAPDRVVIYGEGLGAAVAATVGQQTPQLAAIILENPQPSLMQQVKREQRIHLLPMWLLFQDKFDISQTVRSLAMPKLILVSPDQPEYIHGAAEIYAESPAPKLKVTLHPPSGTPAYRTSAWSNAVRTFLNSIHTQPSQSITPQSASKP